MKGGDASISGIIKAMIFEVHSAEEMQDFGRRIGRVLQGGEVLELVGDIGAGKTTLVKGVARGLGVDSPVQSPSFTISQVHEGDRGIFLAHYDFYRLSDPGILRDELTEVTRDDTTVTVIEWADTVRDVLPGSRYVISFLATGENSRQLTVSDELGNLL